MTKTAKDSWKELVLQGAKKMIVPLIALSLAAKVSSVLLGRSELSYIGILIKVIISRPIYSVLGVVILVGYLFSFFEKQSCKKSVLDLSSRALSKDEGYLYGGVEDLLKDAQMRGKMLKADLDAAEKRRLELEERSAVLEREKTAAEERLRKARLELALEVERLKMEVSVAKRQLEAAAAERDRLRAEAEAREREGRLARFALQDQELLRAQVEAERRRAAELREQIEALRCGLGQASAVIAADTPKQPVPQLAVDDFKPGLLTASPAFREFLGSSTPEED